MLGADCMVSPALIQKNARHKHWASTVRYIDPTMLEALHANDIVCGNDPKEGWDQSYTGHKKSLQRHLSQYLIKHPSQTGSVGLVGGTSGICNIAAKLGAVIIADEA